MSGMYHVTIATIAEQSADFRRVLWTGEHTQLVIMTIPPGGEIGEETHKGTDQILTFVSGTAQAVVAGETRHLAQGDLLVVPAGTSHNVRNDGVNPRQPARPVHRVRPCTAHPSTPTAQALRA
jgi:mannose-6-phosphate isomerase-like protein (cupin superfamily)